MSSPLVIQLPYYSVLKQIQELPPSPFLRTSAKFDVDDITEDDTGDRMFTREVKKATDDNDADIEYYNQWVLSNVG